MPIRFAPKDPRPMTEITVTANSVFELSTADRQQPGGPWIHSFLGSIDFSDSTRNAQEVNVPIIFLLSAIIEAAVLIMWFKAGNKTIPIPSTDREIQVYGLEGAVFAKLQTETDQGPLDLKIERETVISLFGEVARLMKHWRPTYLDDRHFVRSNWIVGAALDTSSHNGDA